MKYPIPMKGKNGGGQNGTMPSDKPGTMPMPLGQNSSMRTGTVPGNNRDSAPTETEQGE